MKKCGVWWCQEKHYAKGYCHTHWMALRRYGSPFGMHKDFFNNIHGLLIASRRISEFVIKTYQGDALENQQLIDDINLVLNDTKGL